MSGEVRDGQDYMAEMVQAVAAHCIPSAPLLARSKSRLPVIQTTRPFGAVRKAGFLSFFSGLFSTLFILFWLIAAKLPRVMEAKVERQSLWRWCTGCRSPCSGTCSTHCEHGLASQYNDNICWKQGMRGT